MRGARGASAVAIEEQLQRSGYIAENALKLGVPNLKIVTGKAPDALTGIGQPDAVFCGGGITGEGVFETAWDVLKPHGVFVANAVTLEGEARLLQLRELHGGEMTRMAVSRAAPVGDLTGWRPLMPVTIWRVTK
jgi:precorrin-6Y C5,15-methyltransferase (decarboxylating)